MEDGGGHCSKRLYSTVQCSDAPAAGKAGASTYWSALAGGGTFGRRGQNAQLSTPKSKPKPASTCNTNHNSNPPPPSTGAHGTCSTENERIHALPTQPETHGTHCVRCVPSKGPPHQEWEDPSGWNPSVEVPLQSSLRGVHRRPEPVREDDGRRRGDACRPTDSLGGGGREGGG